MKKLISKIRMFFGVCMTPEERKAVAARAREIAMELTPRKGAGDGV